MFWIHSGCPIKFKILVIDSIIKSKTLYGLESAHLKETDLRKLEVFHLKALRKVLKMKTTFVDRADTNKKVYEKANQKILENTRRKKKTKLVIPFAKAYALCKLKRLRSVIRNEGGLQSRVTFQRGLKT